MPPGYCPSFARSEAISSGKYNEVRNIRLAEARALSGHSELVGKGPGRVFSRKEKSSFAKPQPLPQPMREKEVIRPFQLFSQARWRSSSSPAVPAMSVCGTRPVLWML